MLFVLAQLVSPPLQPGPARLPDPAPVEQRGPNTPIVEPDNDSQPLPLDDSSSGAPAKPLKETAPTKDISRFPEIKGKTPYSQAELQKILRLCQREKKLDSRLKRCAEALSGKLQQDGYVNSRVFINLSLIHI